MFSLGDTCLIESRPVSDTKKGALTFQNPKGVVLNWTEAQALQDLREQGNDFSAGLKWAGFQGTGFGNHPTL